MQSRNQHTGIVLAILLGMAGTAIADDRGSFLERGLDRHQESWESMQRQYDYRNQQNRYDPMNRNSQPNTPYGGQRIHQGPSHDSFQDGVWTPAPQGRYNRGAPPLGVTVRYLPRGFATIWYGGMPFYYANNVYYAPVPGRGYIVVRQPNGVGHDRPHQPTPDIG